MDNNLFERRSKDRCYALRFLDYEILSDRNEVTGRGVARTINVSEAGLLLEAGRFFEPGQKLRVTLGMANDLVRVSGRVVHSSPIDDDLCCAGILFLEFFAEDRQTYQKHLARIRSASEL